MKAALNMRVRMCLRIGGPAAMTIALLTGCGGGVKPGPPIKAVATLEEVMHHMVIPHAQVVWKSVGTIYTLEGVQEIEPKNTNEWLEVEASATTLMEAGNLLMMEGRAKNTGSWMERAKALREAADNVRQAAKAHDKAAVFERGGYVFDACQGCHFEFRFEKDPKTIRTH